MTEHVAIPLNQIQAWMQSVITHPGHLSQSAHTAYQQFDLAPHQLIKQDYGISAYERLAIYKRGYLLRLLECMRADYPRLQKYWGDELFDQFARAYLIQHPLDSYSLFELGKGLQIFWQRFGRRSIRCLRVRLLC